MALTLVPETLAARGRGFVFAGEAAEECRACPFQRLCLGLEPGHRYVVTALRGVSHPCALHDGGRVQVAEVAQAPFATSVESRLLRGTAASWAPIACGRPECPTYGLCHPVGPRPGRHQIVAEDGPLPCPAGFELARVRLVPLG